ncbi:hypothetical protein Tco_0211817 [Tanacetum coccineum]
MVEGCCVQILDRRKEAAVGLGQCCQSDHYKELTELEIQEMVNILVSGEAYDKVFNHLDMLYAPIEGKASDSVNLLWNKRLSDLNFKNINYLSNQELVTSLLLLVYSKDKPCSEFEIGKHYMNVDQSILYSVSADVDTAYSSKSGNGLDLR